MKQYQLVEQETGFIVKAILPNGYESWIPTDPANSDYQEYLAQLEKGDN